MEVAYKTKKLEKTCTDAKVAERTYGKTMAEVLAKRIDQIRASDTVEFMIQFHIGRCHRLTQDREGQFAVDLVHSYRLVFEKKGDAVQIAYILEIVDYH